MSHQINVEDIANAVDVAAIQAWGPEGFRHIAARVIDVFLMELDRLGYTIVYEKTKEIS